MAKNLFKRGFWNKNWEFQMKFPWNMFPYWWSIMKTHHCFRHWLGTRHLPSPWLSEQMRTHFAQLLALPHDDIIPRERFLHYWLALCGENPPWHKRVGMSVILILFMYDKHFAVIVFWLCIRLDPWWIKTTTTGALMFLWCYPERTVEQMIEWLCFEKWHDAHVKSLWWSLNNL